MIKIGITTFNRKVIKTLNILTRWQRQDIIISTQTLEDYRYISDKYGCYATIIYAKADSCPSNRNNLLTYMQNNGIQECVLLDDDIINIGYISDGKIIPISVDVLPALFDKLISISRSNNALLFGLYPVYNPLFMKSKIRKQYIVIGTIFGILDTQLRFDEAMRVKDDYELCCRAINSGYNCLRFDFLSANAAHYTGGGCEKDWKSPNIRQYAVWLEKQYPNLIKEVNGEVKYIGNKNTI